MRLYSGLFRQEAGRTNDFFSGAVMVVEAMLQSPHFLFRIEQGAKGPYVPYEIASRLSYFLWDTMPSDDMLRAAARGEFSTVEQIEATARRMLEDPRAEARWRSSWRNGCGSTGCSPQRVIAAGFANSTPKSPRR